MTAPLSKSLPRSLCGRVGQTPSGERRSRRRLRRLDAQTICRCAGRTAGAGGDVWRQADHPRRRPRRSIGSNASQQATASDAPCYAPPVSSDQLARTGSGSSAMDAGCSRTADLQAPRTSQAVRKRGGSFLLRLTRHPAPPATSATRARRVVAAPRRDHFPSRRTTTGRADRRARGRSRDPASRRHALPEGPVRKTPSHPGLSS